MRSAALLAALLCTGGAHPLTPSSAPDCESPYSRDQFVGRWAEAGSSGTWTLGPDGSLVDGADDSTGTWTFTRWSETPESAVPGTENQCVLWLKPIPALDLVYSVAHLSAQTITLTYTPRGNTVVWNRADRA